MLQASSFSGPQLDAAVTDVLIECWIPFSWQAYHESVQLADTWPIT